MASVSSGVYPAGSVGVGCWGVLVDDVDVGECGVDLEDLPVGLVFGEAAAPETYSFLDVEFDLGAVDAFGLSVLFLVLRIGPEMDGNPLPFAEIEYDFRRGDFFDRVGGRGRGDVVRDRNLGFGTDLIGHVGGGLEPPDVGAGFRERVGESVSLELYACTERYLERNAVVEAGSGGRG